ncbi:MAG TPA: TVP38/TMEM64 family protein [Sulfurospirillum sp. UBA12182]|nr:MAG TPA: TVP38/TMEM64 family protein [Sulfurospirillum sp. UBA12182]
MIKKFILIAFFIGMIVAYNMLGLETILSFEMLKAKKELLLELVQNHFLLSAFLLMGLYAISVALMIPIATLFSLAAGFMFGSIWGTLFAVLGATLGAVASFYVARFILGESLQNKYAKELERFNNEFAANGYSYLFALRLLPIFPFFLINLLCGLTRIDIKTFFITTFIGIIPGGFAYTYAGSQLSSINALGDIFTKEMGLALLFLGLISLVPVLYKKWNQKKFKNQNL